MDKDFKAPWFDQTTWLFENMNRFQVTANEALVLLYISYFNRNRISIDYDRLQEKTLLSDSALDQALDDLVAKGYLDFVQNGDHLQFILDGLFDVQIPRNLSLHTPVLEEFEMEFKRQLTPNEMDRISQMTDTYGRKAIIHALDEAVVYKKVNLNYIENILISWQSKGLSEEDLEAGKR